ncbi:DUF3658 domain-containing protein [Penaeicola halotolerans]|uniref:DUF3658 domain-containing protein n=1 Tax=Penaeicola halotolerans TaxID=2793196 RepID=UPI001CF83F1F|nr:DUF3658 domain-containing protein [Penaeicola halotolerans]
MLKKEIHIVFGSSKKSNLLRSRDLALSAEQVIDLSDDLMIGPIADLEQKSGVEARKKWLGETTFCHFAIEHVINQVEEDVSKTNAVKKALEKGAKIHIWSGRDTIDRLGTSRLIYEIRDFSEQINILDVPSDFKVRARLGHEFHPRSLVVLNADQIPLLIPYFKKLDQNSCNKLISLWDRMIKEKGFLRVAGSDGEINSQEENYFDDALLFRCPNEFVSSARVVGETLVDINFEIYNDEILNWRLITLAKEQKIDFIGELRCMRDYHVRRKA